MRKQYQLREDLSDIAEMSDHEVAINSDFIREVVNEANCYMRYYHQAKETIHRQGKTAHKLRTRIKTLEDQLETVRHQLEQVKQEYEAKNRSLFDTSSKAIVMLADHCNAWKLRAETAMHDMAKCCAVCQYDTMGVCMNPDGVCTNNYDHWQWRGPCAENGGTKDGNEE